MCVSLLVTVTENGSHVYWNLGDNKELPHLKRQVTSLRTGLYPQQLADSAALRMNNAPRAIPSLTTFTASRCVSPAHLYPNSDGTTQGQVQGVPSNNMERSMSRVPADVPQTSTAQVCCFIFLFSFSLLQGLVTHQQLFSPYNTLVVPDIPEPKAVCE